MGGIRLGGIAVVLYTSPPYVFLTIPGYYNIWRVRDNVPVEMVGDSPDIDDIRLAPELSPDESQITYEKGPDGVLVEVYVVDADGTNDTHIDGDSTQFPIEYAQYPSWSPDGSKVVYTWNDQGSNAGGEIRTANPDGTGITTLWTPPIGPGGGLGAARRPRYSADGTKIAFLVNDDGVGGAPEYGVEELWTMDADGSDDAAIITLNNSLFDQCQFSWANNSNVIAYYSGNVSGPSATLGAIRKVNADGSGDTLLSVNFDDVALLTLSDLAWSPSDDRVFFTAHESGPLGLAFYIHVAQADGSGDALLYDGHGAGVLNNTLHSVWQYRNRLWFFPNVGGVSTRDFLSSISLGGSGYLLGHDLNDTDGDHFYDETGFESR